MFPDYVYVRKSSGLTFNRWQRYSFLLYRLVLYKNKKDQVLIAGLFIVFQKYMLT